MKVCKVTLIILFLFVLMSAVSAADDLNSTEDVISADIHEGEIYLDDDVISADIHEGEISLDDELNNSVIYADAENGNDSNDGLSKDSPVKTINKAYDLVADNGTIYLSDGVYDNPQLFIYKSLSIIGSNNTIIDGGNYIHKGFVFRTWSGSYFLFKNIKFMNVKTYGSVAKVIQAGVKDSTVVIENCDFINTHLGTDDANTPIIRISAGVTTYILNCNFINPTMGNSKDNWAIYCMGKLTINNTKFINESYGGIFVERTSSNQIASLNINNCTFINVTGNGAIRCYAKLNINNSSFINCRNGDAGGAICIDQGRYNKKINHIIINCYFENCYSTKNGGAVAVYNNAYIVNSFTLSNSSFVGCSCSDWDGFGGALHISKNTNAYLNYNVFSECSGKGAAIHNAGNTILNNSIIKNSKIDVVTNMYGYYLGSILNDYGTLTVISSIFENNTCFKTWYRGTHIGTAGIYNRGTLDVSYSAFINNTKIKNIGRIENLNMNEDVYTESSNVKSLDLNWWGSDDNPTDLGLSNYEKINNWFYLDIAPEYLALNINETADVTANFKLSNPNIAFDSGKIPKFNITFSSIVNDKFLYESKNLINNSASVVFDLTQTKGQYVLLTSIGVYSKPTIIDVGKNVSLMNVSVSDIIYGNDLKVNVSVMNNQSQSLKGNVTFKINKKTYNVKLNDGSCTASISGLDPGNYVLKVIYEGNEDYFKSIQYFNVTVNKIPTNLSIAMPEVVYIGNKAIFNTTLMPENFKIKANLYLNGVKDNILYIYGGNTTISLGVRPIGEYNLTVELWNNTYYESSTATATFRVEKYDVNLTIGVDDVKLGENATITINSSPEDFKGYGMLEINGVNQSIFIYNNQTNITLSNLNPGKYDLKLYFGGDAKFKNATAFASFNVLRNNVTLNITVGEGFILVKTNCTDCGGLVSLYVNNNFYTQNLSNGIANFTVDFSEGYNYIYAYYSGDDYYEHATANATFLVPDTPGLTGEDLMVYEHSGEGYVINLNNDLGYPISNATITIEIAGKKYAVITNWEGYALFPLNLDVGDYILMASYGKYNIANNISVKPINLRLSCKNIISPNQNQTITAKVSRGVIGEILFELSDNTSYVAVISDGFAQINISGLASGNYTIKAFYTNEIYKSDGVVANFTVDKYYTPISADFNDTLYSRDFVVKVTLPDNAGGDVTFKINDSVYVREVLNGISTLVLSGLDVGQYNLDIIYSGDSLYYTASLLNKSFKVFKLNSFIDVNVSDVVYGEDVFIDVCLSGDATGTVRLLLNNQNYTASLVGGRAAFILPDLGVGFYKAKIFYSGDDNYYSNTSDISFYVLKDHISLDVSVNDVLYGEDVVIKVVFDKNVSGKVSVDVGGRKYVGDVTYGCCDLILHDLDVGVYDVDVVYLDDVNYYFNTSSVRFNVFKLDSFIYLDVNDTLSGDDAVIKVYLSDNATGIVNFCINDYNYTSNVVNGIASLVFSGLDVGLYDVEANYPGDNHYKANSSSSSFIVYKLKSPISVNVDDTLFGDDVIISVTLGKNTSGVVSFNINGSEYLCNVSDGFASVVLSGLNLGIYGLDVYYSGDIRHYSNESHSSFSIYKLDSVFDVSVSDVLAGEDEIITVVLDKNATGQVIFTVDDKSYAKNVVDGKAVLVLSNLLVKTYNLSVSYSGDNHYYPNQMNTTFSIKTLLSHIDVDVCDVKYGESVVIKANVTEGATGSVIFSIGNITKTVRLINSTAVLEISNLDAGKYNVTAKYVGDSIYTSSQTSKSFNVYKKESEVNVVVNSVVVGENIRIYAVVSPNATGNVTFRMLGYYSPRNKTINGNNASWLISPLKTGQYTIIAVYNGDNNYYSSNTTYYLSVNQIETKLNVEINNVSKTSDVFIKATLKTEDDVGINGQVMVTIGDYDYIVNITDGYGVLNISRLSPGVYNYSALYIGSKSYYRSTFSGVFEIEDSYVDVRLFANPLVKYYSGSERLMVYLTDWDYYPISNAALYFYINGVEYKRITDGEGLASMAVNLVSGNYTVDIRFEGFNKFNALSVRTNITVNPTVEGLNITKIFRNATQYYAIFSDAQGNLLKNVSVRFNINGVFYSRLTNDYGVARLNINLNPGEYILTAENPVTGELRSNLITVLPSIVENHDLNMYYRNGSQFIVRLLGSDGNAVSGEEVTFNINGVFYTRVSDSEGYARLNINLNPGNYIITAEHNGCRVSNNVLVKAILFTNDLSIRYGSRASFDATLVDGRGRLYHGQLVTFNINGVFYERMTSDNGVASLNIRLQAGKYIITSSFNGCNVANTITIY